MKKTPKNSELFHFFYKLSVVPRWEDFSPEYEDSTASHSYRVAIISLLIGLMENKTFGRNIDVEKLVCRAIFHDINEVINGPIKHRTKKNIIVQQYIDEIERVASEQIADFVSGSLKKYFYDYIVNAEDDSPEGRIVDLADTFDVFLFSAREVRALNKSHFQDFYRKSKKTLLNSEFESIHFLVNDFEKADSSTRKLLNAVLRMDQIKRWSGRFNTFPDNDATHTWRAAAMGIFFALYENEKHGLKINVLRLLGKILFHDLPEPITGDVNGPGKHQSKEIKKAFEVYEQKVAKDILKWIPEGIRDEVGDYLIDPKDDTNEGVRVDIVDKIDALLKCQIEMKRNSREYEIAYKRQLDALQLKFYEYPSVQFFLATILHDLYFLSDYES